MPDQYKQYESGPEQNSLETSPPTTPTSEILELENQPPGSESMSQSLSSSGAVTSVVTGMRQSTHRNSQLAMKVKQEVTETNDNCKYQSYDRFRCDTNNNSNKNNCINSNVNNKTMIAKQILSVIRNDDFEELLIILRSKPDLNVFINGQTALHYCLLFGRDVSWCRQLVLNGANPNLSNHDGWHPLHLAASYGHKEILSYLINCNNSKEMTSDVI
jgi:ankyrin repeat protein